MQRDMFYSVSSTSLIFKYTIVDSLFFQTECYVYYETFGQQYVKLFLCQLSILLSFCKKTTNMAKSFMNIFIANFVSYKFVELSFYPKLDSFRDICIKQFISKMIILHRCFRQKLLEQNTSKRNFVCIFLSSNIQNFRIQTFKNLL